MKTALLLIAHGSRHAEANADLVHLAEQLRTRGEYAVVEPSFLELAAPNIEEGARRCLAQGARRVVLVPYFLSPGVHATADLEAHRARLQKSHKDVDFLLAQPLGRHPLLIEVVTQRAREVCA